MTTQEDALAEITSFLEGARSDRQRDLDDTRAIVRRRLSELDLDYLQPRIAEMATLLERDEINSRWHLWKAEASGPT